jgi:hypothetical protein
VKFVTVCLVQPRRTVYNVPERKLFFGLVGDEDKDKLLLSQNFHEQGYVTSEAEILPPKRFCVG